MVAARIPADSVPEHSASLMEITAVAHRLGVEVRHVRRLVHERRIPYCKWGHLLRFDPAEIEEWLDRARRPEAGGLSVGAGPEM